MKPRESTICEVAEETERASAVQAYLLDRAADASPDFISVLLQDEYEVVRAEALDYLLERGGAPYPVNLRDLLTNESSDVVRARLYLLAAILDNPDHRSLLHEVSEQGLTKHEEIYRLAAVCLVDRKMEDFLNLCAFMFSYDLRVSGTAVDLVVRVSSVNENDLVRCLFKTLAQVRPMTRQKVTYYLSEFGLESSNPNS